MAINFDSFTEGTTSTIQSNDYVVGFDTAVPGGERKYTVSTLANAVSGVASLGTVKSVTGTAPISVANGTTTPAISIAAATTSAAGSMSSTDKARLDDASTVNGLLSCNGSGNFSAAVPDIDYALPLPGRIVQSVFDTDNTRITADGNVYIPFDDTIPQISEGKEYLSVTLTPRSSTSKIFLLSHVVCGITSGGDFTVAAFRSGQSNALVAMRGISYYNNGFNLLVVDTPNTTSPVTYSIRIGGELTTSDVCFNMLYSLPKYGNPGAFRSTLFALEIQ